MQEDLNLLQLTTDLCKEVFCSLRAQAPSVLCGYTSRSNSHLRNAQFTFFWTSPSSKSLGWIGAWANSLKMHWDQWVFLSFMYVFYCVVSPHSRNLTFPHERKFPNRVREAAEGRTEPCKRTGRMMLPHLELICLCRLVKVKVAFCLLWWRQN